MESEAESEETSGLNLSEMESDGEDYCGSEVGMSSTVYRTVYEKVPNNLKCLAVYKIGTVYKKVAMNKKVLNVNRLRKSTSSLIRQFLRYLPV